jgi:hypothetical protein
MRMKGPNPSRTTTTLAYIDICHHGTTAPQYRGKNPGLPEEEKEKKKKGGEKYKRLLRTAGWLLWTPPSIRVRKGKMEAEQICVCGRQRARERFY